MSAVLQAPQGAASSRPSAQPRSMEQKICSLLLRLSMEQIGEAIQDPQNPTKIIDTGTASRIKNGERNVSWRIWIRLMHYLGFKLVPVDRLCTTAEEMHMLRTAYAFVSSNPEMSRRFAAWLESVPLAQDFDSE